MLTFQHMLDIIYIPDGAGPFGRHGCWKVYVDGAHRVQQRLNPLKCSGVSTCNHHAQNKNMNLNLF